VLRSDGLFGEELDLVNLDHVFDAVDDVTERVRL
jgi:hypothetical protein